MYNRYIPQSDGTYRRNSVPEQRSSPPAGRNPAPPPSHSETEQPHQIHPQQSPLNFLKNLLPKDFDTADLLIVLLLLLMSGDSGDNQNSSILTLALYLFL